MARRQMKVEVDDYTGAAPHQPFGDGGEWEHGPWFDLAATFAYISVGAILWAVATA